MLKNKFFLVLALTLVLGLQIIKSQVSQVAILLNEYSVGNTGYADNYGLHDAVEIYNAHTSSVSLQSYYLSNDRNNLFKWKFPQTFTLGVGGHGMVYLSGINESKYQAGTWFHHANFTMDQCKKQWLILTTDQGVVRDSIYIQRTAKGHTWGRVDYTKIGITAWRLYTAHSFPMPNPAAGNFKNYMSMPTFSPAAGWGQNGQTLQIFVDGIFDADSTGSCNEVHYTIDGSFPTTADPVYTGTLNAPIIITDNMVFRAVNYPKSVTPLYTPMPICLTEQYLPSFCETSTYLSESSGSYDNFHPDFGVLAVTVHTADTSWFNSSGATTPTVHVEYFDKKQQILEGYSVMRRPPQEAWLTKQKGYYLTIDDQRGYGCNWEGNIFNVAGLGTTPRTVFPTLHVKAGDIESSSFRISPPSATVQGTGLRDVFLHTLAQKYDIKVNPLHFKPLVVFVNAKYKGVYNFAEVYDKFYEQYYNPIPGGHKDSMQLEFYHNTDAWTVNYEVDGSTNNQATSLNHFRQNVYDWVMTRPQNNNTYYQTTLKHLDKKSFQDYMITNSYAMNSNLWNYNVAFGRNGTYGKGGKWHYYLWNVPATFTFSAVFTNTMAFTSSITPACFVHSVVTAPSAYAGNGHGNILSLLMGTYPGKQSWGNPSFQLEYRNRYQDLLNTAFKCENIIAHLNYIEGLYKKEMLYHEDPGSTPVAGAFAAQQIGDWDTCMAGLRRIIMGRCEFMKTAFNKTGCYTLYGPHTVKVDVYPENAGNVVVNTIIPPAYPWEGRYFTTTMSFKAIPTTTTHVFHHWEVKNHPIKNNDPASKDSIAIDFNMAEEVLAVFTDITADVDLPTGFTPNGDGMNDDFKPLGSALYTSEYDFRIWNRWGQEVFRSTDPKFGWDGNYEGKQAQTGVYAYVITYKNVYGENKIKKGNVTLIR
ncbi:MAG: hypothetical protein K0S32_1247 [Bacteroidetes bacterium]|jgi:gliding motility-associated-like protein|nr:hypothetical protein [Bacteroidota bacterium]